ncbi:MAG: universal stress protein [Chloroflexota bacterium]
MLYKTILVPLDGSELAECSLAHVQAVASGCNVTDVILLTVVEPLPTYTVSSFLEAGTAGGDMLKKAETDKEAEATRYVTMMADKLKAQGIAARPVVVSGNAADTILDYATNNQVDMIIMSTHGRSGISRWAYGSVADRVSRHAGVPVLLIAPAGCRNI